MGHDETGAGMEKVIKLTVMLTEGQAAELSRCQQETGANCYEIVRFCIDHSLPSAFAYPSLIHIIPTIPAKTHRNATR